MLPSKKNCHARNSAPEGCSFYEKSIHASTCYVASEVNAPKPVAAIDILPIASGDLHR